MASVETWRLLAPVASSTSSESSSRLADVLPSFMPSLSSPLLADAVLQQEFVSNRPICPRSSSPPQSVFHAESYTIIPVYRCDHATPLLRASRGPHSLWENPNALAEPISTSPSCPPHLFSIFSCSSSLCPCKHAQTSNSHLPQTVEHSQSHSCVAQPASATPLPSDRPLEMSAPSWDFPAFLGHWFSHLSKHLHMSSSK